MHAYGSRVDDQREQQRQEEVGIYILPDKAKRVISS